jgi:hypothetical protein
MLITKTRTTLAAVTASLAFAGVLGSVAPAGAQTNIGCNQSCQLAVANNQGFSASCDAGESATQTAPAGSLPGHGSSGCGTSDGGPGLPLPTGPTTPPPPPPLRISR